MLVLSLLVLSGSVLLCKRKIQSRIVSAFVAAIVFTMLLFSGIWWLADHFTGQGIDELIIFHLRADLSGAGLGEFRTYFIFGALYISAILGLAVLTYKHCWGGGSERGRISYILPVGALAVAIILHPLLSDVYRMMRLGEGEGVPDEYYVYDLKKTNLLVKKNIVYIWLESVEATYLDESIFPGLMPNISSYLRHVLSFGDIRQFAGDSWTIGGLVSSQCGVPLTSYSGGNSYAGIDSFLPGATCLGDVLRQSGYHLEYYGGSASNFAGKGNFFRTHGFDGVFGLDELKEHIPDAERISRWGLYDDDLFDIIIEAFSRLYQRDEPFGLFALTLDTHHPRGHPSKACANTRYKDGSNAILNAVHCVDKLLFDLVSEINELDTRDDTIIVVSSDHLAMPNTATEMLKTGKRRNLFFVLNSGMKQQRVDKQGVLYDIGPTVLDILGSDQKRLGFGTSLLDSMSTSLAANEDDGQAWFLRNWHFLSSLWRFPSVRSGVLVDVEQKQVVIEGQSFEYPMLLTLDGFNIERIFFEQDSHRRLNDWFSGLEEGMPFLWLDSCHKKVGLSNTVEAVKQDCVSYGRRGKGEVVVEPIQHGEWVFFRDIYAAINPSP